MIDLSLIEAFDWDEGNSRKSQEKHGVDQVEVEQIFSHEPLLVLEDVKHSKEEPRFHAYGRTLAGRLLQATFTIRDNGKRLRVISCRDMSRKERERYEKADKA